MTCLPLKKRSKKTPSLFFFTLRDITSPCCGCSGRPFFHEHRTRHFNVVFIPRHSSWSSPGVAQLLSRSRFFMCSWESWQGNSPDDRHPSDVRDGAGPRTLLLPDVTVESVTSVKFHDQSPALALQGGDVLDPSWREGIACVSSEVLCCQLPPLLPLPPSNLLSSIPHTHHTCPHNPLLLLSFPVLLSKQLHALPRSSLLNRNKLVCTPNKRTLQAKRNELTDMRRSNVGRELNESCSDVNLCCVHCWRRHKVINNGCWSSGAWKMNSRAMYSNDKVLRGQPRQANLQRTLGPSWRVRLLAVPRNVGPAVFFSSPSTRTNTAGPSWSVRLLVVCGGRSRRTSPYSLWAECAGCLRTFKWRKKWKECDRR